MNIASYLRIILLSLTVLAPITANAVSGIEIPDTESPTSDFVSIDELLYTETADTQCATKVFADALAATVDSVNESSPEHEIQQWIYTTFSQPNVLQQVLECPEIANADETASIRFIPIEYTFPGGRKIVVNYETQPKIFKQRLMAANKRSLPDSNPSPRVGAADDTAIWTNTDPAWYGIMVVQTGALREFAGEGKNNTISMKYISDNIDSLYPKGYHCTSKSALALDSDELNQSVTKTVGLPDGEDTNDYYVAGDVNLQWISYLEIALDVVITVATFGGGAAVLGATKAARASKALKGLSASMCTLRQTESVQKYMRLGQKYARAAEELKKLDKAKDATAYAKKSNEVKQLGDAMRNMERADDNVRLYKKNADTFSELNKYRHNLQAVKRPAQRGNIMARTWRSFKAANSGGKLLKRSSKLARAGAQSGKIRDWLFHSTMKNIGKIAKLEEAGGLLYGAITFAGDMYDWTETSTGDYTNGIDFKPLLLLSADDIKGQENVVNYGMWLMWAGDSVSAADDDAAYLQAMDFAEKVWQDLLIQQEEAGTHHCNVDIYVVRPIIRNPGEKDSALYYLIMNDEPWTTADRAK
ncbi:MAG: hypothetical protein K2I81_01785 [Alphaproteobacteria bacterium]|nr:hypothetical protein [Alphaproteobacteria bacterium]